MPLVERLLRLAGTAGLLAATACPPQSVQIVSPRQGLLTAGPTVAIEVRVPSNHVATSGCCDSTASI